LVIRIERIQEPFEKVFELDADTIHKPQTKIMLKFAQIFDGFSIGSNDLTQLTLGIDRDSTTVAPPFDERSEAVTWSCARVIAAAHAAGRKVGICGQAPSDFPEFAAFLVEQGIDSISHSPDALARTLRRIVEVEGRLKDGASRARSEAQPAPVASKSSTTSEVQERSI